MTKEQRELLQSVLNGTATPSNEFDGHRRFLLIDLLNLAFRNFAALNVTSKVGDPSQVIYGCINSLRVMIRDTYPTDVILVADGKNSTAHRKRLYPGYKAGREVKGRIARFEYRTLQDEHNSFKRQLMRVMEYFDTLPVRILSVEGLEADDVIAHLCNAIPNDDTVIISSSDRDFLQLLNDVKHRYVYSPIKKIMYDEKTFRESYENIFPPNFALVRAMSGDKSDCIPGVKGIGEKTAVKYFPFLTEQYIYDENYLISFAEEKIASVSKKSEDKPIYHKVANEADTIRLNYRIMQLLHPEVSLSSATLINQVLRETPQKFKRDGFNLLLKEDSLDNLIPNTSEYEMLFETLQLHAHNPLI